MSIYYKTKHVRQFYMMEVQRFYGVKVQHVPELKEPHVWSSETENLLNQMEKTACDHMITTLLSEPF